jgi:uncharacterized protein YbjQ (UPF0145 family)
MRSIFGGRSKSYENELASGVSDALAEMEQQAACLGADPLGGAPRSQASAFRASAISVATWEWAR